MIRCQILSETTRRTRNSIKKGVFTNIMVTVVIISSLTYCDKKIRLTTMIKKKRLSPLLFRSSNEIIRQETNTNTSIFNKEVQTINIKENMVNSHTI